MSEPNTLAANQKRAQTYLERFTQAVISHFINGERVLSVAGGTFQTLDPTTNAKQCTVASGEAADVGKAALAASTAFGGWRDVAGNKRRVILHAIADAIEARADEIALVESSDTGQPIRYMAKAALRGAERISASTPIARRAPQMACRCRMATTSTIPCVSRLGRSG